MARLPAPKLSTYYLWCDLAMWAIATQRRGRDEGLGSAMMRRKEQAKHMSSNEIKTSAVYKLNDLRRCTTTSENSPVTE